MRALQWLFCNERCAAYPFGQAFCPTVPFTEKQKQVHGQPNSADQVLHSRALKPAPPMYDHDTPALQEAEIIVIPTGSGCEVEGLQVQSMRMAGISCIGDSMWYDEGTCLSLAICDHLR